MNIQIYRMNNMQIRVNKCIILKENMRIKMEITSNVTGHYGANEIIVVIYTKLLYNTKVREQ